ncbi:MAG TPA: LAGLIDADG family homing endonuclease [Rubricoccaceae bacterium]|nr:LAGLIDADG family homing endonuclease [Rubricoccaceae bacterium]
MATKKATLFPDAGAASPTDGLHVERVFSTDGQHPFDSVAWETRTASIKNHKGEAIFEQEGVEFPKDWSPLAVNVVASKYFYGDLAKGNGSPAEGKREYSLKQLVHRVTRTISDWGHAQGYFATKDDAERFYDELTWLCVNQYGAFNSPVWFNVGLHHQYGVRDTGGKTISGWNAETGAVEDVDPYERPQASACFIIAVDDSIDDIWKLMKESARLFKFGSGVGADWSKLRSSREKLSGGGTPSGPVSFMKVQDATGGTIKSGGKTRRAAIMQTLKSWHPDVLEFVRAKQEEERKAWALIEEGYDGSFNGPAYGSVAFQNVNQSLRVDDAFMEAAEADALYPLRAVTTGEVIEEVHARDVLMQVAEGTWICGDPGVQYEDTIQRWHTVPNSGPINSSNPCVTGDTLVATEGGLRRIDSMLGETPRVVGLDGRLHRATRVVETGVRPVYRLRTRSGYEVRLTADHRVWTENRGDVPAAELVKGDLVRLTPSPFGPEALDADVAEYAGLMLGDGCVSGGVAQLTMDKALEWAVAEKAASVVNRFERRKGTAAVAVTERATSATVATGLAAARETLARYVVLDEGSAAKRLTDRALRLDRTATAALLRGLFTADGTVVDSGDKSQYVGLDSTSEALLKQVQVLLLGFGIKSKLYRDRRLTDRALLPDGQGGLKEYRVEQMHSLRITRSSRTRFELEIGFMPESEKAARLHALNARVGVYRERMTDEVVSLRLEGEEPVYDLTEPATSHFVANGVAVHNCSEYMHLDNSACNLASLNLRKFQKPDGSFDVARFRAAARVFITAQEILVDNAGYPSHAIARNSHDYRPLGLGFANLGALLMAMGLPYDSDEGRAVAGAVMAIEHCEAYARSAEIAGIERIGPFPGFEKNREPMLEVMRMHRDAVKDIHASCPAYLREAAQESADRMVALGERYGYRNAQATVLAPTGTIGFMMDCDTTGIEPDIALVKYKLLAGKGDGLMKIVNQTVGDALKRLGYTEAERAEILAYVDEHDTIEGAPGLREEHLPVFDCAFKPHNGQRSIGHMGHIRMMAAVQPFVSGAISKTVNLPEHATVEDIYDAYVQGWKLGLKAVAIYRENSKRSQPLSTRKGGNTAAAGGGKGATQAAESSGDGVALPEPEVVEKVVEKVVYRPVRKRLPDERPSVTHKFSVAGHEGYLHVGLYPDTGMPGEIFITMAKQGSTIAGLMDSFATAISLALQYGVPLDDLVQKFSHVRFEPSGFTNNRQIPIAKSITDYIFRYLSLKFLGREQEDPAAEPEETANPTEAVAGEAARHGAAADESQADLFNAAPSAAAPAPLVGQTVEHFMQMQATSAAADAHAKAPEATFANQEDAPACPNCGSITVRAGACYSCPNCGSSTGCG